MTTRHIESPEGFGQFANDANPAKAASARNIIAAVRDFRTKYGEIRLPNSENFLRRQAYEILSQVRQPSDDERRALEKKGIQFFHIASSKSYAQLVAEDPASFHTNELEHANANPELRYYVLPVAVEVGVIKPTPDSPPWSTTYLPNSFEKSRKTILEMIEAYSQRLQEEFPDVRAIALPSIGYALLDKAYNEETGNPLFNGKYARALDNPSAVVGRGGYVGRKMSVEPHYTAVRALNDCVWAFPAIVFVGNK